MAAREKGTVIPLSSVFPEEEARKAAQRVQDSIAEKSNELDKLHSFVDDNTNLINLVQRLPDELNHDIMVPFGKGAFFPGRLVHTNEFMVLLGEGYIAERTAKQTVDILRRRGKTLDSHVDSLKAVIEDLKTEALFFDSTAAEAAAGLVDIREEYIDDQETSGESQNKLDGPGVPELHGGTGAIDDEEYARIMSRFDELEKEELEKEELDAENAGEQDDDVDEDFNNLDSDGQSNGKEVSRISLPVPAPESKSKLGDLNLRPVERDLPSNDKVLPERSSAKGYTQPVSKSSIQPVLEPKSEYSALIPKPDAGSRIPRAAANSLRAFTGSIIEHTDNLPLTSDKVTANQPTNSQSSKPVSRFKMQRRAA